MIRLLLLAALGAGAWLGWEAREFVLVDRCLDAGGAWDERTGCRTDGGGAG